LKNLLHLKVYLKLKLSKKFFNISLLCSPKLLNFLKGSGTFVKGNNSGATGFLRYAVSAGVALTVTETSGNFIKNEALIFNGIANGRVAVAVTEYGISNIKSLWGTNNGVVGINTFCADVIQTNKFAVGVATISPASGAGSISTVRSTNPLFPGTGELVISAMSQLINDGDNADIEELLNQAILWIKEDIKDTGCKGH